MTLPFTYTDLSEKIFEIFTHLDDYKLAKHIEEFKEENTYVGDFLVYYIFEPHGTNPPTIYTINSPYDMITKKSPQQALVFEDGKLTLDIDFTHFVDVRTGVMDSLMLKQLGINSLADKKILYVGTGHVANESLKSLKEHFGMLQHVDFYNRKKDAGDFGTTAQDLGITTAYTDLTDISEYDIILCHTSSPEPVLKTEHVSQVKKDAVIFTYVTVASDKGEVADEFFDSTKANMLMDWPQTLNMAKDIDNAMQKGLLEKEKLLLLQNLFSGNVQLDTSKQYTIYRSSGTPMQNLAVLKLLLAK